jgi:hypothetical protein
LEEAYEYAVEMDSSGMIYVPSFIKTGSVVQALEGIHEHEAWSLQKAK